MYTCHVKLKSPLKVFSVYTSSQKKIKNWNAIKVSWRHCKFQSLLTCKSIGWCFALLEPVLSFSFFPLSTELFSEDTLLTSACTTKFNEFIKAKFKPLKRNTLNLNKHCIRGSFTIFFLINSVNKVAMYTRPKGLHQWFNT